MFEKTVQFKDFNNKQRNVTLYFHLSTPDVLELQFNPMVEGDMDKFLREGVMSEDGRKLLTVFKLLVANSYGRRSEDGSRFVKKAEWTEEFMNNHDGSYESFFEWLLLDSPDGDNAKLFYNGIMPQRLREEVQKRNLEAGAGTSKKDVSELSVEDLQAMLAAKVNTPKIIEG